ncbi:hypothetical protein WAI453_013065 [Rhynchosporium graminicola]
MIFATLQAINYPTNTDNERCFSIVKSRLQAYIESRVEAHKPPSPSNNHGALDGTNQALLSSFRLKRIAGTGLKEKLITAPPRQKQLVVGKDEKLVQDTALWLKDELKNMSMETYIRENIFSDISQFQLKDEACTLADHLWKLSDEVENESAAVVWSIRYIATCASVVGTVFTSPSKVLTDLEEPSTFLNQVSSRTLEHWQGLVRIVNTIVNMMLLKWGDKAYVIYHIFAGTIATAFSWASNR